MAVPGGAIIENMSSRKLTYLVVVLLLLFISSFFLGAIVSPKPNGVTHITATKCVDLDGDTHSDKWFYPRGAGKCDRVHDFAHLDPQYDHLEADNIVFSFQLPHPGSQLDYSRWQQYLMGIMTMDIEYEVDQLHDPRVQLLMKARLGYRNKGDADSDWKPIADSLVHRNLDCDIENDKKRPGYYYNCTNLNMFELGSLHHDYYLLNVRLPATFFSDDGEEIGINEELGKLNDVHLIAIHQNGGFTKVWVGLKTIFFPVIVIEMIWYWRRIRMLPRNATLLEKTLFVLGSSLTLLNLPLEYFTLSFDMPWLTMFNDIKQGLFYAALMTFWLIFAGEHCINESGAGEKNGLKAYWKKLATVLIGCTCLFVFDVCERGVQLKNPFETIWSTDMGTNLALGFIILAGISAGVFFLFLCYLIYRVFMTISEKRASISAMSRVRRIHYEGIIWRFRFLMLATLVTAAMTTIGFILGQVSEGQYKWDENIGLEYGAGGQTGVYGMWNVYIMALLFLYAPSHKEWNQNNQDQSHSDDGAGTSDPASMNAASRNSEEIEFSIQGGASADASELSSLTEFMRKQATD